MVDALIVPDTTKKKLTDADTFDIPGGAVMRGGVQQDEKPGRSVDDIKRIMSTPKAKSKDSSETDRLVNIMRGNREETTKTRESLDFTDRLFGEVVGATTAMADLAINSTMATASGLYGLGRLALGDDPDEVSKKMSKWHVDVAGSMEGAGSSQEAHERNMGIVNKVFSTFKPVAESFGNSMIKPQPVYDEDGNTVAMAKPIPVWATSVGHAAIEIGPFLLAGEVLPKGFRAGKARFKRGKMAPATGPIETTSMAKQSRAMAASEKIRTGEGKLPKELLAEAEAELAALKETPLPTSETTSGPTYIDGPMGQEKLYTGGTYKKVGRGMKDIWDRATKEEIVNNASGESAASVEAISRLAQQEDMLFFRVDTRKPNHLEPIAATVDRIDLAAGEHQIIMAKKIGDPRLIVIDSGKNMKTSQVARHVENLKRKSAKAELFHHAANKLYSSGGYEMAAAGMRDTIRKLADNKVTNALEDFFYIEPRFERLGAPETAFHVKNTHSYATAIMEEGAKKLIEQAEKVGYDPKVLHDAVLIAESKQLLKEKAGSPAGDMAAWMRKEFDTALRKLNEHDINVNFKERMRRSLTQKLRDSIELRRTNAFDPKHQADIAKYRQALTKLEDFEFVSIPKSMWFEQLMKAPATEGKALRILNAKERRIMTIGDLEPFLGDKINAMDVMGNYFHKLGNDLSIARVLKAGLEEGLVTKNKKVAQKLGYERISAADAPAFSEYYLHEALRSTLQNEFIKQVRPSLVNEMTSLTKMMTFDSPWFLGYYNMIQAAWKRGPHHIPGIILDSFKAQKMIKAGHPEVALAVESGLRSTPYPQPFQTTLKVVQDLHKGLGKRALEVITENTPSKMLHKAKHGTKFGKLPVVPEVYALLWDTAWNYFDFPVRMGTYNWLRKNGMKPREAAQTAALYHGDYAAIPRSTRVMLNKMFYTPTFKIAMAKLHGKMLRGAVPELLGTPKGKYQKMGRKAALGSIATWWATNQLFDTWMQHGMGFEQQSWGRRYSKQVETEMGTKDLTVTLAHPMNLLPKYGEKLAKVYEKGNPGATMRSFTQMKYDMTPLLTITVGALENKSWGGEPIYNTYDDPSTKGAKVAWNGVQQVSSWSRKAFPDGETRATKRAFYNEVGFGLAFLLDTVSNQYLATQKDEKLMGDIQRARRSYMSDLNRMLNDDKLDGSKFNELTDNFLDHIGNILGPSK